MDVLDWTRLQFAVVTIYHYFFVPLSISLAAAAAGLQIAWLRPQKRHYLHLTKFVGKILIVTFAVGVVTGLVQEFQFGLGWSAFARFYGDVFGPTLAIEGMLAFFLEATFLALWYFGWDRLPPRLPRRHDRHRGGRYRAQRVHHPGRQLVHAEPGGVRRGPADRTGTAHRLRGAAA